MIATVRGLTPAPRTPPACVGPAVPVASSTSPSRPGSRKRSATIAKIAKIVVEMPRCTPSGSPIAMAPAAMDPPSTAPMDHTAWKPLMIDRP